TWEDTFAPGDHDIYARLVDPTGALQGTGPISVDFTTNDDENPSISKCNGRAPFATQRWTIVYQRVFLPTDHDIWGAQYLWDGSLVNASFMIDFTSSDDYYPQPSSLLDGSVTRDYLVAYQELVGTSSDIHARIYNETAMIADANISALEDQGFTAEDQI